MKLMLRFIRSSIFILLLSICNALFIKQVSQKRTRESNYEILEIKDYSIN
jgi:hypothetical protein